MDTVEMKAFHMMENREDVAVARATAGMIMMADTPNMPPASTSKGRAGRKAY